VIQNWKKLKKKSEKHGKKKKNGKKTRRDFKS